MSLRSNLFVIESRTRFIKLSESVSILLAIKIRYDLCYSSFLWKIIAIAKVILFEENAQLGNYYDGPSIKFSQWFLHESSRRKEFFLRGVERVMTVIKRWILMHFTILDISYAGSKVPPTTPDGWNVRNLFLLFFSSPLFFFVFFYFPLFHSNSPPFLATHSTVSLCFSLNFYLWETCGQVFSHSPLYL